MHYKNGRDAKVGDQIVGRDLSGIAVAGIVIRVMPESDSCNLQVAITGVPLWTITASECLHVDDAVK
jgi:hypothetical protein